ncbi:MAG: D-glycero-beta-D-manno-heptose 1-phosphate adenylyltransferase [Bacteroidota bacterium]|jgi:D-beta-D-heptose 7-phosphate kinase/D-beta-D-heptose 1-phosphate adenosyltransferase
MKTGDAIEKKIMTVDQAKLMMAALKVTGKKVSFTNGCFDIIHPGHLFSLKQAAAEADYLIVGLNSDASVRKLKGPSRPINNTESRALVLANLIVVDAVIVFEEETPLELIKAILPDVMVKGGDYTIDQVVGGKEVIANGGKVIINPIVEGFSTTGLIEKMKG